MTMVNDNQIIMARDIGYILAVTARWRRDNVECDTCIFHYPYLVNGLFRPQPRIIRSLDMKSRAYGQNIVRFSERRGDHWKTERTTTKKIFYDRGVCHEDAKQRSATQRPVCPTQDGDGSESRYREKNAARNVAVKRAVRPPGYPDPVELSRRFADNLARKLLLVSPEMILCTDDIIYVHEMISAGNRRRLQFLIHKFNYHHVLLAWPTGWVFTMIDAVQSPRLQKASAAVLRDGHLCCDTSVLPLGVVHDVGREPGEAEHPVILITAEGFVYMYDDGGVMPILYQLTKYGFLDFCRRGLRERCGAGLDLKSTPVEYDKEPLKSLLEHRSSIDKLIAARNRLLGSEAVIFHTDEMWTFIRVSDLRDMGYEEDDFENWRIESGHLQLEPIFTVKAYVSGAWVDSPVLVSDVGTVFYVEPGNSRLRFLAADLYSFLVLGVMRFRSNSCFPRGTFTAPRRKNNLLPSHTPPIFCPRGHLCKRNTEPTLPARVWRRLRYTWGVLMRCCRTQ